MSPDNCYLCLPAIHCALPTLLIFVVLCGLWIVGWVERSETHQKTANSQRLESLTLHSLSANFLLIDFVLTKVRRKNSHVFKLNNIHAAFTN